MRGHQAVLWCCAGAGTVLDHTLHAWVDSCPRILRDSRRQVKQELRPPQAPLLLPDSEEDKWMHQQVRRTQPISLQVSSDNAHTHSDDLPIFYALRDVDTRTLTHTYIYIYIYNIYLYIASNAQTHIHPPPHTDMNSHARAARRGQRGSGDRVCTIRRGRPSSIRHRVSSAHLRPPHCPGSARPPRTCCATGQRRRGRTLCSHSCACSTSQVALHTVPLVLAGEMIRVNQLELHETRSNEPPTMHRRPVTPP